MILDAGDQRRLEILIDEKYTGGEADICATLMRVRDRLAHLEAERAAHINRIAALEDCAQTANPWMPTRGDAMPWVARRFVKIWTAKLKKAGVTV